MIKKLSLCIVFVLMFMGTAFGELRVVATLPWIGSLVNEIGKDRVHLDVIVKPSQDPHFVEAKPSMILTVRRADVLIYNGLDLEIGYLPVLLESSRNKEIQPGTAGNVDCSRFVNVIDRPDKVDRSMGDVHPYGNPHYHFSPGNIQRVAAGITEVLSQMDSGNTEFFRQNMAAFTSKLRGKESSWKAGRLHGKKVIAYHKLFEYLAAEFGLTISGYVEPKPGIPPSAAYVGRLIEKMKEERIQTVLTTTLYPRREVDFIAGRTGAQVIVLPHDVGSLPEVNDWFTLMDTVLSRLQ
jgi:zinc/manganese transport system substrate-binding protein